MGLLLANKSRLLTKVPSRAWLHGRQHRSAPQPQVNGSPEDFEDNATQLSSAFVVNKKSKSAVQITRVCADKRRRGKKKRFLEQEASLTHSLVNGNGSRGGENVGESSSSAPDPRSTTAHAAAYRVPASAWICPVLKSLPCHTDLYLGTVDNYKACGINRAKVEKKHLEITTRTNKSVSTCLRARLGSSHQSFDTDPSFNIQENLKMCRSVIIVETYTDCGDSYTSSSTNTCPCSEVKTIRKSYNGSCGRPNCSRPPIHPDKIGREAQTVLWRLQPPTAVLTYQVLIASSSSSFPGLCSIRAPAPGICLLLIPHSQDMHIRKGEKSRF
ncbi:hypothetical protein NLU13_8207 [Sarocladium strictum]|uniref:Uncharacterized protein n=1 Tax=Sarocladium strictum TaxID=5046 RepID=A0AA39GCC9_SARSR|nr:hypothetical protein NLU13_8207 [Sarocladium strictum]